MNQKSSLAPIQVGQDHYHGSIYHSFERFISYFTQIDLIEKSGGTSVLIIGVGDAIVPDMLRRSGYEVTTIDIDPALHPSVVADIREMPFSDEAFDVVCAFEVLEHLPFEESQRAISEIARVSNRGAIISVPHRRTGIEIVLKFPFIRTLLRREYLRVALLLPIRFGGFAESGQHYWEIDFWTTALGKFRSALRQHFTITEEHTAPLDPYRRFFMLTRIR